jgi:hypothetical protein
MNERVYEMLWDCSACGTVGLLGKSQRRCPNCGSPQDVAKRYFPKPGEEVAVSGHRFEGADWTCAACTTPNGAAASFCQNCGNPKEGNANAALQADRVLKEGALLPAPSSGPPPKKPMSKLPILIGAGVLVVGVVVAALLLIKKDATVDVTGHVWSRSIAIERFDAVRDSAWCDSLPGGAYSVSRSREVRSHRQIADGQDCHDRQVDRGDGTFVVKTECKTKYRDEPVYDDKCSFLVDRWAKVRDEVARGGLAQQPAWPALRLASGSGRGAEREGGRSERYTLQLRDAKTGKVHECDYPEPKWRSVADRSRHTIKVRLVGSAVCESLK